MSFAGVNYFAVVIATLAGFGLGAVWYMILSRPWLHAVGKTEAELKKEGPAQALPFVIALVALFVMALMLAGVMGHIGDISIRGGAISGFFVWLGFVITTMGVNHAFSGAPTKLTLIDGGYWLAVLLIQGAVIGAFGV
jgi:Protein of unknown function (DUF1761)